MKLTGKELTEIIKQQNKPKPAQKETQQFTLTKYKTKFTLSFTSLLDDEIILENITEAALPSLIDFWTNDAITYTIENNTIKLEPNLFWKFYKSTPEHKKILTNTGFKMKINGKPTKFAGRETYFSKNIGIYGIIYHNHLLYVGSSITDYMERWKQHQRAFAKKDKEGNAMYALLNLKEQELEYKLLYTEEEINQLYEAAQKLFPKEQFLNSLVIQALEKCTIEKYKPYFNHEGIQTSYKYTVKSYHITKKDLTTLENLVKPAIIEMQYEPYELRAYTSHNYPEFIVDDNDREYMYERINEYIKIRGREDTPTIDKWHKTEVNYGENET